MKSISRFPSRLSAVLLFVVLACFTLYVPFCAQRPAADWTVLSDAEAATVKGSLWYCNECLGGFGACPAARNVNAIKCLTTDYYVNLQWVGSSCTCMNNGAGCDAGGTVKVCTYRWGYWCVASLVPRCGLYCYATCGVGAWGRCNNRATWVCPSPCSWDCQT